MNKVKENKSQSKKAKEMHTIMIRMPKGMYEEIKKKAEQEMRPLANYVVSLLAKRGQK